MTRVGNLRVAPLFLRASVVRRLIEGVDAVAKGVVEVPVAPIKLVDVPRRSEDPRLAKANDDSIDDSTPSGWVAPPVASEPEDWPDAPLPDHADPDLDRPEPVEDASPAPAKRVRKSRPERKRKAREPRQIKPTAKVQEPAQVSHAPVQTRLPMHPLPHVADQPLPAPTATTSTGPGFYSEQATKRRLQDAGRHRARAEQIEVRAKRIARRAERAAEVDSATAEFAAALERVRARRAEGVEVIVRKPAPPTNAGAKLAEAIRLRDARKAQTATPAKRPIERALSREECRRCGVPGWKGCEHQLPLIDTIDPASLGHSNSGPRV